MHLLAAVSCEMKQRRKSFGGDLSVLSDGKCLVAVLVMIKSKQLHEWRDCSSVMDWIFWLLPQINPKRAFKSEVFFLCSLDSISAEVTLAEAHETNIEWRCFPPRRYAYEKLQNCYQLFTMRQAENSTLQKPRKFRYLIWIKSRKSRRAKLHAHARDEREVYKNINLEEKVSPTCDNPGAEAGEEWVLSNENYVCQRHERKNPASG